MMNPVTDGGRNPAYEGRFSDETPEMHLIRLAQARRIAELEIALRIKTEEHDCCAEDLLKERARAEAWLSRASLFEEGAKRYHFLRSNHRIGTWKVSRFDKEMSCYTSLSEDHLDAAIDEEAGPDDSDYTPLSVQDTMP